MSLLQGKAVVITGSGHGIGAACAKGVARQGASVVINDINRAQAEQTVEEIKAEGGKAVLCIADISNWDDAGRLIQTCVDSFGKIDGLVNNAIYYYYGHVWDYDPVNAERSVLVGVMGPLHCNSRAITAMMKQGFGSIVNVVSGAHMGMEKMNVYGAIKGAVASMIYTSAIELAGTGVRINGMSPFGATDQDGNQALGDPVEGARRQKILPDPKVNAPMVDFLLSDLSKDVNGQIIRLFGEELWLQSHPAILMPSARRSSWSAEEIAGAFANEFKGRQIPCGVTGTGEVPQDMASGFWAKAAT